MKTQDHNECPFSDEIVSYIYGEMPDSAQLKFESHLAACQVCTDDFAAVSFARFETYDWKKIEFDPLETPQIVIPYPEKAVGFGERIAAWVRWVTVIPAAAVLAVALGIAFLVISNDPRKADTSLADVPKTEQQPSSVQTPEAKAPIVDPVSVAKNTTLNPRMEQVVLRKKPALPKTQYALRKVSGMKLANDVAINMSPDQVKRAPRLGMNDPEEDRSLRLADLFDETNPPPER